MDLPNNGGDLIFQVGAAQELADGTKGFDGAFRFRKADGTDLFVIHGDGKVEMHGEELGYNRDAWAAFAEWLSQANQTFEDGALKTKP